MILLKMRENSGQVIMTEWTITLVVVLTALTMMVTYVRRAYQARIYDTDTFMLGKVGNAFGNYIALEYEPYYAISSAGTNSSMQRSWTTGSGAYVESYADAKRQAMKTTQLPPMNYISWW